MAMTLDDLERLGKKWMERIRLQEKQEDHWIKQAERAERAYACGDENGSQADVPDFNILHSNVETMVPAIFNSAPEPDIRPRHGVDNKILKDLSDALEAAVRTQVDDSALEEEIEIGAQDAFLAGRGVVRVKFEADEVEQTVLVMDALTGEQYEETQTAITGERVEYEAIPWRNFRVGAATRWKDVPWIAISHMVSDDELKRLEDLDLAAKYAEKDPSEEAEQQELDEKIWECWDRENGVVVFVIERSSKVISITDDPLGLPGFFPVSKPVHPLKVSGNLTPICPYSVYRELAEELDKITRRINKITSGLKVRGIIAGAVEEMARLAEAEDNELIPLANLENLAATGGLDKAIAWWPIEVAAQVLKELYVQRDATKQVIYEVTGISDIVRGQGAASETATAQEIKSRWGSLRIKKMQKLIERQARELMVMTVDIIASKFSQEALQLASGQVITPEMMDILHDPRKHLRIDVETDSTIRGDLENARREMSEFLNGTAQFFSAMAPVVAQAPPAAASLAKMYRAFARQFSLGKSAEDALEEFVTLAEQAANAENPEMALRKAAQEAQDRAQAFQEELGRGELALKAQAQRTDAARAERELGLKEGQLSLDEAKAELDGAIKIFEGTQINERTI